jgi:hyperosmotically inducible periplasmic protein
MQLNPKRLVTALCLGAVVSVIGLTGCHTHGDRSEGRYHDDKKIASNVKKDLKDEPVYKFEDVHVAAYDGVVQLAGFVNTEDQKNRASEVARRTDGVREVVNSLVIKPQVAQVGPAPVVNNQNRITTTGTPTGRRIDAQTSSMQYNHGQGAGATGATTGTAAGSYTVTPSGPATTTTAPVTPSETKPTETKAPSETTTPSETKAPSETGEPSKNISAPNVNITTPNVNINTNAPGNPPGNQ